MRSEPRVSFHERKRGWKAGERIFGNDEQTVFNSKSVKADEKFRELMTRAHNDRYVENPSVRLGTERPRYVSLRGLPRSGNASPAALCAAAGEAEGGLSDFR